MENKVIKMLDNGLTAQQIADDLGCDFCAVLFIIKKIQCEE